MYKYYKYIFFIIVLNSLFEIASAQVLSDTINERPMNLVYINAGGGATSASIEYERLLWFWTYRTLHGKSQSLFISGGLGFGTGSMQYPEEDNEFMTLPIHISANIGKGASFFETGVGTSILFGDPNREAITYYIFGYRLEPRRKYKVLFRINFCIPFHFFDFYESTDLTYIPLSFSLGIAF